MTYLRFTISLCLHRQLHARSAFERRFRPHSIFCIWSTLFGSIEFLILNLTRNKIHPLRSWVQQHFKVSGALLGSETSSPQHQSGKVIRPLFFCNWFEYLLLPTSRCSFLRNYFNDRWFISPFILNIPDLPFFGNCRKDTISKILAIFQIMDKRHVLFGPLTHDSKPHYCYFYRETPLLYLSVSFG